MQLMTARNFGYLAAASTVAAFIAYIAQNRSLPSISGLLAAEILGQAVGLIAFGALPALLIASVYRIATGREVRRVFSVSLWMFWAVFAFGNVGQYVWPVGHQRIPIKETTQGPSERSKPPVPLSRDAIDPKPAGQEGAEQSGELIDPFDFLDTSVWDEPHSNKGSLAVTDPSVWEDDPVIRDRAFARGLMHEKEGNYIEAVKAYREAAMLGHQVAQSSLANMYGEGLGVPQNFSEAYVWSSIAAVSGDKKATKKREHYSRRLSPEDLAKTQATAAERFREMQSRN